MLTNLIERIERGLTINGVWYYYIPNLIERIERSLDQDLFLMSRNSGIS